MHIDQSSELANFDEPGTDMTAQGEQTVPKAELLRSLDALAILGREYRGLLERIWEDDAPGDTGRHLLAAHRALAHAGSSPFDTLGPAEGLLRYVMKHVRVDTIAYRLPEDEAVPSAPASDSAQPTVGPPALPEQALNEWADALSASLPPLEAIAARVYAYARASGRGSDPRIQRVLGPLAALLKAIARRDWQDAALVLVHLNMVTTTRSNHEVMEQIGRLVRGIHESLVEISSIVPIDALHDVSEEIPDAVEKLQSVIRELEDGANRNLDLLEALSGQVSEGRKLLEGALAALASCDEALQSVAEHNPAAEQDLQAVRAELEQGAADALRAYRSRLDECHDLYMTLFSNQSYQDLTGQTLKNVIAFIEGLQYQLIQVISKESGIATASEPPELQVAPDAPAIAGPDAQNRLSQDKVDSLLAEMGF